MLSKVFKPFVQPASNSFKNIAHKSNRNLWLFRRNAEKDALADIKYDEITVESIKDPRAEFVKPGKEKVVGYWLLATAGAVFCMITLGGYTRLSKSGLSMTKWKPIAYKYPRNQEQWEEEFENYKKYPEYLLANKDMDVHAFKSIFLVEYAHRTLGNIIGAMFGLPLIYFLGRGYLRPKLRNRCLGLFAFGGVQGLIGWWMVKSGMQEKPDYQTRPRVSPYRLLVHLNAAILIYGALFWNGLNLVRAPAEATYTEAFAKGMKTARGKMIAILHFIALNIISGVTVAGIDAGKVFNTWPDMNGGFMPAGYLKRTPLWSNFFENMGNVQFNHRIFAYITYVASCYLFYLSRQQAMGPVATRAIAIFFFLVNFQVMLGITTLLRQVPVGEAVSHQANAVGVLSAALYTMHTVRRPNPRYFAYVKYQATKAAEGLKHTAAIKNTL